MCKASSRSPLDLEARICVLHYLKLFAHRTLLFKMLPMIKVGGLIIRTLTKPLAKAVKTRSKMHPYLNQFCHAIGQKQHRYLIHLHMSFRGVPKFVVKDLPPDQAVEQGADLIGEIIIFSVAVAVASFEYHRSSLKAKTKEEIEQQQKQQAQEVRISDFQYNFFPNLFIVGYGESIPAARSAICVAGNASRKDRTASGKRAE